jgi:spermidine synthase
MARRTNAGTGAVTEGADDEAESALADSGWHPDPESSESSLARFRMSSARVPLLFMASGAAGLIYQVVWTNNLILVFGNTTQAIVTTVAAFLCGLGIGSLIGAAIGVRLRRPLAVYGLLEAVVAGLALLMPLAFDAIATVFRSAYLSLPPSEVALIRFVLAFLALTPVTLIMGMTLPILTRHLVRADPDVGQRIARLYGLNTLGAVIGTVTSGYVLIELLGLRETTFVAVGLNLTAGLGALLIARTMPKAEKIERAGKAEKTENTDTDTARPRTERRRPRLQGRQWLLLGVTFISGLVSLAMEVLWTRVFQQGTGSPIYVFVAVLAIFLIGIAGGSLVYERRRHREPRLATLGTCLACAAFLTLVPVILSNIEGPTRLPWVIPIILPVTGLLGYAFPLTARLFVGSAADASRGVGLVYAANTAGCVVGTVTAGLVLIPILGTLATIVTLCTIEAVLGSGLAIAFAPSRRPLRVAFGLCVTAVLVTMAFVPVASQTYIQRQLAANPRPKAHFEDTAAMVDVVGGNPPRARNLYINGEGITRLTIDTKLLAYLPKALRPNASSMLNICFGMGTTFRSSIILGLHTDAVELDPTVPTLMHWFYRDANRYLHSPLAHIIISDGRNYVRLTNKHYDLITIDAPPPIWSAGAVVLLTHEFYQEARQRLNPGGVLASFIPYSGDAKLFLRTFRASFRYVTVLHGPRPPGMYLLGSDAPMNFRASAITQVFGSAAAQADLANAPNYPKTPVAAWPKIIHQLVWLTNGQVNSFAGPGPLLTDDHPLSEYFLIRDFSIRSNDSVSAFELPALRLAIVATGLLCLLICGLILDALWRRPRSAVPR